MRSMTKGRSSGGRGGRAALPASVRDQAGFGLVEALVAVTLAMIGLLAVAGLQLSAATQGRIAHWRTSQALVAQEVFEALNAAGYASVSSGTRSVTLDGQTYTANVSVTNPAVRVKQVTVTVSAVGSVGPQTFLTRIHEQRPVPPPP